MDEHRHPTAAAHEEHRGGDHESHDHMDHGSSDHGSMDHGSMGHHGSMDHGSHGHMDHVAMFRRLFWIMCVIAIPVVFASPMFGSIVGYTVPDNWVRWISPVLGTLMYVWGGRPFLTGAVSELRSRTPGMMTLIALAITVAFVASWGASLHLLPHDLDFWWELALLIVIMLLGHWIEMRSIAQTTSALDSLASLMPDEAERIVGEGRSEHIESVAPSELATGDVVIVRPGGRVPADGVIIEGTAELDESMITGESDLVTRDVGDKVVAGTVTADSAIKVRVRAVGDDTTLAGIQRLVAQAQNSTSRAQRLADRAAGWLFWFALGAAVLTAVIWTAIGQPEDAVIRTITVLVIACPHALGLAIPLVVSIATERAARMGVLVTNRIALETLRQVDVVCFDKTGTLTRGRPEVTDIVVREGYSKDEVLGLAASAEMPSEHPLARAIVRSAQDKDIEPSSSTGFSTHAATGVHAVVDGRSVSVGGPRLVENADVPDELVAAASDLRGNTVLYVLIGDEVVGVIALADEPRPESAQAVADLRERGIESVMITGDARDVAERVAKAVGITQVHAQVRPEDKEQIVSDLQKQGHTVAFVGDGVNDAPALARADVGIAIGAGTDVAIGSAGVVLAGDDPRTVVSAIELSRKAYRKMKQNLWWAAGYNLISVPLAAGILAPIGFVLPMAVGALLMSLSTIIVALNAQLLRRADLHEPRTSA